MAKDNSNSSSGGGGITEAGNHNLSTPSSSLTTGIKRTTLRSKPYDANNSFVKKVATKVTDLLPQRLWISKWFNSSQDETDLQNTSTENAAYKKYEDKESQPPPIKRPCIRMDVIHPPGTFSIQPRNKNIASRTESSQDHFVNNETTQDFLEPSSTGPRLHRFVASTPAFPIDIGKSSDARSNLNILISEQNNNGTANGIDDNSESSESTSGCSSLIPQNNRQEAPPNANYNSAFGNKRRFIDDKLSFTNHLQSPRSLFLDSSTRETLSSRQPSFNPLMINRLQRSSSLSSPFYPGNTIFGGANAANLYRSSSVLSEPPSYQVPKRTSVQVKPSTESTTDLSGMSQTARRILETLEQFSSPLSDAKKIPMRDVMGTSIRQSTSPSQLGRKRAREEESSSPRVGLRHLTRELMVPTVPEILRIRRREKLQNTTVNARKIMTARNAKVIPPASSQEYHIRSGNEKEPNRSTQLKAKKKTNLEDEETVEALNLPTMPLPISNLPRFDISLPQCTIPANITNKKLQVQSQQNLLDKETVKDFFKFASPIKITNAAKNLESINNFTFSKPITPSKVIHTLNESNELSKTLSLDSNESVSGLQSFPNFIWTGPSQNFKLKEKNREEVKGPKVASILQQGSVMDFFAKKSPSNELSNIWECNECLIKNNENEKQCIACKSTKVEKSKAESVKSDSSDDIEILECPNDLQFSKKSQSNKFKSNIRSNDKLSSSDTFVSEKVNSTKIQSQSSKPSELRCSSTDTGKEKLQVESRVNEVTTKPSTITISNTESRVVSQTLKPFKVTKSSWECPCCMVHNVESVTICPCCNTAKPGSINVSPKSTDANNSTTASQSAGTSGFGDKFKKPEGSWSCDTCMVQNKAEVNKCVACETPRTATAVKSNVISTSLDVTSSSGFGDKFNKPKDSWTCDSCMLSNKFEAIKCIACEASKPGSSVTAKTSSKLQFNVDMPENTGSFKFGIDKADDSAKSSAVTTPPKTNGFTFGNNVKTSMISTGFSFGVPSSNKTNDGNTIEATTATTGFAFKSSENVTATATFQFGGKSTDVKDKNEAKTAVTINFPFGTQGKNDHVNTDFIFGSALASSASAEKGDTKSVAADLTFAAQPIDTVTDSSNETSKKNIKPKTDDSTANAATKNFLFNSPKSSVNVETDQDIKKDDQTKLCDIKPVFGAPEQPQPATSNFTFNALSTNSKNNSTTNSSLFTFSGQPKTTVHTTASTMPQSTFGASTVPKPVFSFGKPNETSITVASTNEQQQTETKAPAMSFESTTTNPNFGSQMNHSSSSLFGNLNALPSTTTSETKPILFSAPENKITPIFGQPESKAPAFGATDKSSAAFGVTNKPSTGVFSSVTHTTTTPATSPFSSTTNLFSSGSPATFGASTTPGIFSTKPAEATSANQSLFTFGQSSQPLSASTGSFNFNAGSNATANNDKKSGIFTFGASSNNTQGGNGFSTSSFNAATPSATAPTFTFNAPPKLETTTTTGFGQSATAPMFNAPSVPSGQPPAYPGTVNPTPATDAFNFGNTSVPTTFNFGSSSIPSGGFNFNAPSNPAATIAFDPNAQPTFNFTAGNAPTAFNATPKRKMRKAIRRMPRQ